MTELERIQLDLAELIGDLEYAQGGGGTILTLAGLIGRLKRIAEGSYHD